MPGFPVYHQLPELAQINIHRVGDTIQPSHPLSAPSPPPPIFPSIRVFSNESVLCIRWPKYWSFNFSICPFNGCPRDSEESSPTPQLKTFNSLALSFLYIPTLTSIHGYWENHSYTDLCQ